MIWNKLSCKIMTQAVLKIHHSLQADALFQLRLTVQQ